MRRDPDRRFDDETIAGGSLERRLSGNRVVVSAYAPAFCTKAGRGVAVGTTTFVGFDAGLVP